MNESAWRTMNWIRISGEVFMVQQRWELHEIENKSTINRQSYGYSSQESFPTDDWRIVNLKEMVDDHSLEKLLEAKENAV